MLEVKDLVVAYGRVKAVKGISFTVEQGQVVTLLGTNGAGKSTTLRTISGLIPLVSGEIWFEGKRLDGIPAHKVVERGKPRYVVMDIAYYDFLRECEIAAAWAQTRSDLAAGHYRRESADAHRARLASDLADGV